jgi:hypothetical protein
MFTAKDAKIAKEPNNDNSNCLASFAFFVVKGN